jgi:glutathione S-transferase
MCHLLGLPFELRTLNGLAGPGAEAKQAPFLRLNPLGQVRAALQVGGLLWNQIGKTRTTRRRAVKLWDLCCFG